MALGAQTVKSLFDYDPDAGLLTWRIGPRRNVRAGDVAGSVDGNGRVMVMVGQKSYYVSRVIWLWMTGAWPTGVVDHIDRNNQNNRWANLRDVSSTENNQNKSLDKRNSTGVSGVRLDKATGKWHAQIGVDRKRKHLGYFADFEQAVAARKAAEAIYYKGV